MPSLTLEQINAMTAKAFRDALGGVFEHSPWVAERAAGARPFASVAALHAAMVDAVRRASRAAARSPGPRRKGSQGRNDDEGLDLGTGQRGARCAVSRGDRAHR